MIKGKEISQCETLLKNKIKLYIGFKEAQAIIKDITPSRGHRYQDGHFCLSN